MSNKAYIQMTNAMLSQSPVTSKYKTLEMEFLLPSNFDEHMIVDANFDDVFPFAAIVKCGHCGQHGARKTACKYCGAPID